ncbi:MAG: hypothetical protein ACXWID_05380 [Pyrinomonadaceae bacterium]
MRRLIILTLLLAPLTAKADEPRFRNSFASVNGKYELRRESEKLSTQSWSLVEKSTGRVRYQVAGEFGSRTVLLTDDGVNLVVVDDFSERRPSAELEVLMFYRDGIQIKKYSLGDLLADPGNIQSSVSHFRWLFRPETLSLRDSKLRLETFELINYEFDIRTGERLRKETDPVLAQGSVFVYGAVRKLSARRYEISVCRRVYGVVPESGRIEFEADRDDAFPGANVNHSVVIRNGKLVAKQGVILNSCNFPRANR